MRGVADAVYIIQTEYSVKKVVQVKQGGGICIDPRGLIVTVAHLIPAVYDDDRLITVRARNHIDFFTADVLNVNYGFDICFY